MTDWPKPVSDELLARQRRYVNEKLGAKVAEAYRVLLKSDVESLKRLDQARAGARSGQTRDATAKSVA